MNFLKINVFSFFCLHENRDGHLAGLMEAKPEELGRICSNRKDVPSAKFAQIEKMCHFTFYNFVFMQIFCRCNR